MSWTVDPLLVLQARAEARALLFRCSEFADLGAAVTPLLVYSHEAGLATEHGSETVLSIIKQAFGTDWIEGGDNAESHC